MAGSFSQLGIISCRKAEAYHIIVGNIRGRNFCGSVGSESFTEKFFTDNHSYIHVGGWRMQWRKLSRWLSNCKIRENFLLYGTTIEVGAPGDEVQLVRWDEV